MDIKNLSLRDLVRRTRELAGRYSFAAVAVGMIVVMTVLITAKDIVSLFKGGNGEQAFALQAGGQSGGQQGQRSGGGPGGGGRPGGVEAPLVSVAPVQRQEFSDAVRALGTAQARESITVTAKVSDVIRAIRFESGDHVKKGQVLVELANVEQIAAVNESKAQLEVDKRAYSRYKELYDRGFSPKAKIDEAEAALARSQADLDTQRSRIEDRTIRAPFAGIVGLRTASPGMLATPGAPIATLDDTSVIKLDFDVPEARLSKMTKGAPLVANTAAYPDLVFNGAISQIDSRVNPETRTVRVRALLPNPSGRLKPGMLMTVDVLSNKTRALAVPDGALIEEADAVSVYRISTANGRPSVEKVAITAGRRQNGQVEILDGLNEGDSVVSSGTTRVRPGQTVRIDGGGKAGAASKGPDGARQRQRT